MSRHAVATICSLLCLPTYSLLWQTSPNPNPNPNPSLLHLTIAYMSMQSPMLTAIATTYSLHYYSYMPITIIVSDAYLIFMPI